MTSTTAFAHTEPGRGRLARLAHVVVDGRHPWGNLQIDPVDRTASAMVYRLTVYPPGITIAQRRALVFRRHWPATGTLLGMLTAGIAGEVMNAWAALALGAAIVVAGWAVTTVAAGDASHRVLKTRATTIRALGHREVLGDLPMLERAAGRLLALDTLDGAEALSPAEYEFVWNRIYQQLEYELRAAQTKRPGRAVHA